VAEPHEVAHELEIFVVVPAIEQGVLSPVLPVADLGWRVATTEVGDQHPPIVSVLTVDKEDLVVTTASEVADQLQVFSVVPAVEEGVLSPVLPVPALSRGGCHY